MTLTVGQQRAQLFLEADNRISSATVEVPPIAIRQNQDPASAADLRRRRLVGGGAAIDPPDMRAWQVPFVMPDVSLVAGFEWTDTLAFTADPGEGMAASIEGVWRNRVVGDTTIGGIGLPVVRTEADVRYTARELVREYASDEPFVIERDVSGTILGYAAIDTTRGVRAAGVDTARWSGTATLRTSDGGVYPSGVRYERQRAWTLRDSLAHLAYEDSLRDARRATAFSIVRLPRNPIEERLAAGDSAAADSLFDAWRATTDPDERVAIAELLGFWRRPAGAPGAGDRLLAFRAELGDTATIIETMVGGADGIGPYRRITAERLDSILPYLLDISRMWRLGILPRGTYSGLGERVLRSSPILPEESSLECDPEACARIAGLVDAVDEPRLNDVAIVAAFSLDPARWFDRLRERAAAGSRTAGIALRLATGVTGISAGADEKSVPDGDAGWRDWLAWMNGDTRWRPGYQTALLFYQARTGRDPLASMQALWPPAEDSARLVLGTILRAMDRLPEPTAEQLASTFDSSSAVDVRAAREQLLELFYRNSRPAPELAAELILPVLDSLFAEGGAPWPQLPASEPATGQARPDDARPFGWGAFNERPVFIFEDAIPGGIGDGLPALIQQTTRAEWDARPVREGGALLSLQEPRVWGDFASVGWSYDARVDRAPDEAPSGYAGGTMLFLMRTAAGWRIVGVSSFIT